MWTRDKKDSAVTLDTTSVHTTRDDDEINWDDIPNDKLQELLISAVRMKRILELENDLFYRYLKRHDPSLVQKIDHTETSKTPQRTAIHFTLTSPTRSMSGSVMSERGRGSPSAWSMQSGMRRGMLDPMMRRMRITIPQRMEMIDQEIIEIEKTSKTLQRSTEKDKARLKAQIEEYETRIREIYETKNRFETDVVVNGVDALTGKIPAEKFIKFVKDWLKNMNRTIEKIRLKSDTTRSQIKRAQRQMKQREDLGEDLCAIDFEKLKIENQDYRKKIADTSVALLDVKKVTARYNLEVTEHKRKLADVMTAFDAMKREIDINKRQAEYLESKCVLTEKEIKKADKQLAALRTLMNDYEVPAILDFVELQSKFRALQKMYVNLVRRRNVLKIISTS